MLPQFIAIFEDAGWRVTRPAPEEPLALAELQNERGFVLARLFGHDELLLSSGVVEPLSTLSIWMGPDEDDVAEVFFGIHLDERAQELFTLVAHEAGAGLESFFAEAQAAGFRPGFLEPDSEPLTLVRQRRYQAPRG